MKKNFKIATFTDGDFTLDVKIDKDNKTIWLTCEEIGLLFEKTRSAILKHILKIYGTNVNLRESTCSKYSQIRNESGRKITRQINHYNLDIILLVGHKTNSKRVTIFRDWTTNILNKESEQNVNSTNMALLQSNNYQIICFSDGDFKLDVNVSPNEKTVWLTQRQIALLFDTSIMNISLHINNILKEEELDNSVLKESFITAQDGKHYSINLYNLDMIISIGYRVKSKRGILFRRWAINVLTNYLVNGFAINPNRCIECKEQIIELQQNVSELQRQANHQIDFQPGDQLITFIAISNFLKTAKQSILIIDNYFDHTFDDVLKTIPVKITIITDPKNKNIESNDLYEVIRSKNFHDRYIFVDDICYKSGDSLRSLGKKVSSLNREYDRTQEDMLRKI